MTTQGAALFVVPVYNPAMSHTYAILPVPPAVYAAIRAHLEQANYQHAFHEHEGGEVIDMHGIALQERTDQNVKRGQTSFTVSTFVSRTTKEGRLDVAMNGQLTQLDLDRAREIIGMLQWAVEAAVSDALLYKFLVEKVGLSDDKANMALLDFREMRQGSRDIVHPH